MSMDPWLLVSAIPHRSEHFFIYVTTVLLFGLVVGWSVSVDPWLLVGAIESLQIIDFYMYRYVAYQLYRYVAYRLVSVFTACLLLGRLYAGVTCHMGRPTPPYMFSNA